MEKPVLLIDVDGVISLFGFDPASPPAGRFQIVDGITHYLSASAGKHLRTLEAEFDLVWCTGWEDRANDYLPLALGLPKPLPLVAFDAFARPAGAHWKLAAIDDYVGSRRAVAWIDDAHNDACTHWAAARAAPTLLIATDPAVGLDETHVNELLAWARPCSRGPALK
jgi:HAD domain in Swiss Army Knife RNA repair proteins